MKKNYYICVGLRNLVTKGELGGMMPSLPLDQEIHLDNIEFIMGEENINVEDEIQDLKDKMGAKMRKVRLTKGTLVQLPPASALVVDCSFSPDE